MVQDITGKNVPNVTFKTRANNDWKDVTTSDIFDGKTVVVFSLPGAFTPTCSSTHLPGYMAVSDEIKACGVDTIACLSVNDSFVMNAWQKDQGAESITMIPDGNGEFSKGMGMLVDKSDIGFGDRSWRYSMLVKNGKIEKMFIENQEPGDPFAVSDAKTMLNYLQK
jgi:peroxiredoxin